MISMHIYKYSRLSSVRIAITLLTLVAYIVCLTGCLLLTPFNDKNRIVDLERLIYDYKTKYYKDHEDTVKMISLTYELINKLEDARQEYDRPQERFFIDSMVATAHMRLFDLYYDLSNYEKATIHKAMAIKHHPDLRELSGEEKEQFFQDLLAFIKGQDAKNFSKLGRK